MPQNMNFSKKVEYVNGTYRGYLNGIVATSLLSTKEEVLDLLEYIENILNF